MGFEFGFLKELFDWDKYKISHSLVITVIIIVAVMAICIFVFGFANNSIVNWIKGIIMVFAATFSLMIWHDHQIKKEIEEVHSSNELKEVSQSGEDQSKFIQPNFNNVGVPHVQNHIQPVQMLPNVPQNYNDMVSAQMVTVAPYSINGGNQMNSDFNRLYNMQPGGSGSTNDAVLQEINETLNNLRHQSNHLSQPVQPSYTPSDMPPNSHFS